jgi:putative nucleotidyltransferase with HDIG domain
MIEALVRALDAREHATSGHSMRVTAYSMRLAVEYGIDVDMYPDIYYGSLLHDIGKIGIPDAILLKTSGLTDEERVLMESHVDIGLKILERVHGLGQAHLIPRYHHERFDGCGYGAGLAGLEIPIQARVFAIADVYDALRTERPYKPAFPHDRVVSIISEESGRHFDPDLVDAFLTISEDEWERLAVLSELDMSFENLLLRMAKSKLSPEER